MNFPTLHSLGNGLAFNDVLAGTKGQPQVAVPFFESATIQKNLEGAKAFELIITGSTWNVKAMVRQGLTYVRTYLQGVDLNLFSPGAKAGRFVILSGVNLE